MMEKLQTLTIFLSISFWLFLLFSSQYWNFQNNKNIPTYKHFYQSDSYLKNRTINSKSTVVQTTKTIPTTTTSTTITTTLDPTVKEIRKFNQSDIVISFYTSVFGDRPWGYFLPKSDYEKECHYDFKNCVLDYDINKWKDADIVFFHARDMPSKQQLESLKKQGKSSQLWVYFIMENPFNAPPVSPLNDLFEMTSSYRYYSDFFVPYGYYDKLSEEEMESARKIKKNYAEGKDKQIAWMVGHCGTLRDRLAHKFEELGLNIYVGGGCAKHFKNQLKCPDRACTEVLKKFKFYFSAENNLCDNYITEKYWENPFNIDAIPITLGGSNYSDPHLAIPGSFINALDFNSPKDLVSYIKKVDSNDKLFNQYFEWKKYYKLRKETYGCNKEMNNFCTNLKKGIKLRKNPLISEIGTDKECSKQENFFRQWIVK